MTDAARDSHTPASTPHGAARALTRELATTRAVVTRTNSLLAFLILELGLAMITAAIYVVVTR